MYHMGYYIITIQKKTEENGQELEEWGCITNCDICGCVT
jgi:hypothetical protein